MCLVFTILYLVFSGVLSGRKEEECPELAKVIPTGGVAVGAENGAWDPGDSRDPGHSANHLRAKQDLQSPSVNRKYTGTRKRLWGSLGCHSMLDGERKSHFI